MTPSPLAHPRVSTGDLRPFLLASALRYAGQGMAVHPLLVGCKEPRWSAWEERATLDPELISRTWGRAPFNIGVACGPSSLVAIDLDVPKDGVTPPEELVTAGVTDGLSMLRHLATTAGEPITPTMAVRTCSGGLHLIYTAPAGTAVRNSAGTVAWCIDVRAAGGYIVGIGSVVEGAAYTLAGSLTTPAVLPDWMLTLVTSTVEPPEAGEAPGRAGAVARLRDLTRLVGTTREQRWAAGIFASELAELQAMRPQTGRTQRLNLAAYRAGQLVGAGLLDLALAERELVAVAEAARICSTQNPRGYLGEIQRTVTRGLRAGIGRPRHMDDRARQAKAGGAA
ncbi:bifunctional DNA primase/polymerase [Kitasatospora sp. NPDC004723]|uniref:bifunctional DNA primase/polymerase n=1 Tax=Kitasatospora sp. NPDC004723 TaxID=3154288 RepID=UPI0033A69DA3